MLDMQMELCPLKYRSPKAPITADGKVVLLVVNDQPGLRFYVHPNLNEQVADHDRSYLANLIPDLLDRAKETPGDVFRQLCQLSVGPLAAEVVERTAASEREINRRYPELQLFS